MATPPPDTRHKVWLYRDPQRTAFLIALLGLLCWNLVGLVQGEPDTYAHQHARNVVIGVVLVTNWLAAAYAPRKWGVLPRAFALALSLGCLAFVLLA